MLGHEGRRYAFGLSGTGAHRPDARGDDPAAVEPVNHGAENAPGAGAGERQYLRGGRKRHRIDRSVQERIDAPPPPPRRRLPSCTPAGS